MPRAYRVEFLSFASLLFGLAISLSAGRLSAASELAWVNQHGHRNAALAVVSEGKSGFNSLPTAQTSITFTNFLSERRHLTNQILLNGSGVAAGDVNGDGLTDLYFASLEGPNLLYRNLGNWKFQEISEAAGVQCREVLSTGCALVDLDGDQDLDLLVNSVGQGTRLFFNDGKGRFTAAPALLNPQSGGMSMAVGDLDGDSWLDLYVANYRTQGFMDIPSTRVTLKQVAGRTYVETFNGRSTTEPDLTNRFSVGVRGNIEEHGEPDRIYRNVGGTNFLPLSFTSGQFLDSEGHALGIELFDWGLSVMIRDANHDGRPDIYVCNDFQTPDRFWINQGNGKFQLISPLAQRKSSMFSMAVDFADLNRDGHDDFLVVDMLSRSHSQRMRETADSGGSPRIPGHFADQPQFGLNTLFLNRGNGSYAEISQLAGLEASEWSWSCTFLDVDLDGYEDVLISNGMERAARDADVAERLKAMRTTRQMSDAEVFQARRMFPRLANTNLVFRNRGDLTFEEMGGQWGFNATGVSHGFALADLDNDGDLDVALNNLNAAAGIYRNETSAGRVAVRLKGLPPNTQGIGARITLLNGAVPIQSQVVLGAGRYLSSDDALRTFATGSSTAMSLEVLWPSGQKTTLGSILANHIYEIAEGATASEAQAQSTPKTVTPLFEDVSAKIAWTHVEEPYDDFVRQPLLSRQLSHEGPGAAWIDYDQDGWDDLVLAGGKSGVSALLKNTDGNFQVVQMGAAKRRLLRDQLAVLPWFSRPDQLQVLFSLSNYEDGFNSGASVESFNFQSETFSEILAALEGSAGAMALADTDADGDLDLFVAGRAIPGRYPVAASSRLYLNNAGQFVLDDRNLKVLDGVGLVTSATFSDMDGDGDSDLLLGCEWGSPKLLQNESGVFRNVSEQWGLATFTGWWTSVTAADFNEDGRMDFLAGNWGRNTPYQAFRTEPLRIYYGDFDGNGSIDPIEAHYDPALKKIVPFKTLAMLSNSLPFLKQRFSSHRAFSTASIQEILGDNFKKAAVIEAKVLDTTVFLNKGSSFEAVTLPVESQFSPVFGVCAADFTGDGHLDIFLAQNFHALPSGTPRYDAGNGLLLVGNGRGTFQALPSLESGLEAYGEQKAAVASDFDKDGRLDLLVTQNSAGGKLFRNAAAAPGVRVRLIGPPANPLAVGTSLRLVAPDRSGPRVEITAGTGYLSHHSPVQILPPAGTDSRLEIRWADGSSTNVVYTATSGEVVISRQPPVPR